MPIQNKNLNLTSSRKCQPANLGNSNSCSEGPSVDEHCDSPAMRLDPSWGGESRLLKQSGRLATSYNKESRTYRNSIMGKLVAIFLFEGGLGLIGVLCAYLFGIDLWGQVHWHQLDDIFLGIGLSVFLFVFFLILNQYSNFSFIQNTKDKLEDVLISFFSDFQTVHILLIALLSGCGEEILFRGFLQQVLQSNYFGSDNIWLGIFLSNMLFGLAHWLSPFYALYAGVLGLILGVVMVYSDNLLTPILIHTTYNFLVLYYLLKYRWKVRNRVRTTLFSKTGS